MKKENLGIKTKQLWENPEYRKHMSEVHKGKTTSQKQKEIARKNWIENNPMKNKELAKRLGEETSKRNKGKGYNKKYGDERAKLIRKKQSNSYNRNIIRMHGKKQTKETRKKISISHKKEKCHFWIDGRSYNKSPHRYRDDWNNIRQLIYKRDNYICQDCKQHKKLDIHHIVSFMETFDNSLNNLISLCRSCHIKREMKLLKERKNA